MLRPLMSSIVLSLLVVGGAAAQELRIGMFADPATLDPVQSVSFSDRIPLAAVCDKLVDIDAKLAIVPQLAKEWSWSADSLSLTMMLRPGVLFQDGELLDAEAVKFNIERTKSAPYARRPSELKPVRQVVVVDPLTVRFELSEPFTPLLALLSDRAGMMVSPKAARELGDKMANKPVCAGPYKIVEWVRQDRIVFEKFDRYWNAAAITIPKVTYLPLPDDTVRLANLRAGSFQLTERVAPSDVARMKQEPGVTVYEAPSVGYRLLTLNLSGEAGKKPLGGNPKIREAFELSIDRAALNQVAFDGLFIPSNQPEAPGTTYYDKSHPVPDANIARARALVAAAGFTRVPVSLQISNDPLDNRVAQVIQAMASEAGFDVSINVLEATTGLTQLRNATFEVALVIWSGRPDPDANIGLWVACDGFVNYSHYCEPKLDAILRQARSTADVAARAKLYADAAAIYLEARPYIFLYHMKWFWAASSKLSGFGPNPDGIIRVQGLRLEK